MTTDPQAEAEQALLELTEWRLHVVGVKWKEAGHRFSGLYDWLRSEGLVGILTKQLEETVSVEPLLAEGGKVLAASPNVFGDIKALASA